MVKFQDRLVADGYCDSRAAGFCATATNLPRGEHGFVALCVNGSKLNLYDVVDMKSNLGELLYEDDLKRIENLKIKSGFFSQVLRFEYEGCLYAFTNFYLVKPALKVIEEEASQR